MGKATLKRSEIDLVMRSVANVVQMYVRAAAEPLIERIAELEKREPLKGEKGDPGQDGKAGPAGSAGAPGRDGIDGKDGTPGERGLQGESGLDGKDGAPGRDGRDGLPGVAGKDGLNGKDGINGKDGANGLDGKDGLGFDDMTAEVEDDGRVLVLRWVAGERKKEVRLTLGTMIYRGVFSDGKTYERGDVATWGGSVWHCNSETNEKPGDGSKNWTLAVKKGRDGRDGKDGDKGERGPEGKAGRSSY
jgi:collagen type III alpha